MLTKSGIPSPGGATHTFIGLQSLRASCGQCFQTGSNSLRPRLLIARAPLGPLAAAPALPRKLARAPRRQAAGNVAPAVLRLRPGGEPTSVHGPPGDRTAWGELAIEVISPLASAAFLRGPFGSTAAPTFAVGHERVGACGLRTADTWQEFVGAVRLPAQVVGPRGPLFSSAWLSSYSWSCRRHVESCLSKCRLEILARGSGVCGCEVGRLSFGTNWR
mmetsp:Transcript_24133/g.53496  ORF Transcript_24133/g.53496 Transcript_24133/m.53496 type:complete len:218 (-) Transcript_24133:195-848(-)